MSHAPSFFQLPHNQRRVNFYQAMVALEDVETQKRGVVLVLFHFQLDGGYNFGRKWLKQSLKSLQGLPDKFMGVHYCCSEDSMPFFLPFQNMIQYLIGSHGRMHFRAHCGKHAADVKQLWAIMFFLNDTTTYPVLLYTYTVRCIQRLDYGNSG